MKAKKYGKDEPEVDFCAAALRNQRQDAVVDRSSRLEQVGVNSSSAQFLLLLHQTTKILASLSTLPAAWNGFNGSALLHSTVLR